MSDLYQPNIGHPAPHQRATVITKVAASAPAVKLLEAKADRRGVALTNEEASGGSDAYWGTHPGVTDADGQKLVAGGSQATDTTEEIWVYSLGAPVICANETLE